LGDDVITAYISGIQFLPVCIMYMRLCPEGAEGSSYSMLTTFGNIALVCASSVGNLLANVWDVSNVAMRKHDISGLYMYIYRYMYIYVYMYIYIYIYIYISEFY
jgi:hypothetical protein